MEDKKTNRDKWLHLRLTAAELEQISKNYTKTTQPKLSDYCRGILLGKPMIKAYRNQSLDALIVEFSTLNKTLNGIANNYNQALHRLHQLPQTELVKHWFIAHEADRKQLVAAVAQMKGFMEKHASSWLQS